jgi:hypothetical protein
MQREEMELMAVRATLWRMEIEILREIHRYRFAKRGRRFGSDVELMIVYGAAMSYYGFGTPVRALPISRYLEMPRETVRRHMGRLVALGLFEREKDQTFVPTKQLREVEIERALRLLRQGRLCREIGGNSSPMSISRMSLASDRRPSCSGRTRRDG